MPAEKKLWKPRKKTHPPWQCCFFKICIFTSMLVWR